MKVINIHHVSGHCRKGSSREDLEQPAVQSHVVIIYVHVQAPAAQYITFYQKLSRHT